MKAAITFIATLLALSAYSTEPDKVKQDSIIDTTIQAEDTIGTRTTLRNTWMIIIVEKSAIQT